MLLKSILNHTASQLVEYMFCNYGITTNWESIGNLMLFYYFGQDCI